MHTSMEKQIISGGYLTHALTDGDTTIFGLLKDYKVGDWSKIGCSTFYWSDVFVYDNQYTIIRKGNWLVHPTNEELDQMLEQSKVNLH